MGRHWLDPAEIPIERNTLRCIDRDFIDSRGWLHSGPAPFTFNKSNLHDMIKLMQRPWVIDHPETPGLWRATGLESQAMWEVRQGQTIGLLIEPWSLPSLLDTALAVACREWIKGCSCAPAARPQDCQKCTAGFLAAVLKRAQAHGLTIGSNALDFYA